MGNVSDNSTQYCKVSSFAQKRAKQKQLKFPQRAMVSAKLEKKELFSYYPVFDDNHAFVITWEHGQLKFSQKTLNL